MKLRWVVTLAAFTVAAAAAVALMLTPVSVPEDEGPVDRATDRLGAPFLDGSLALRTVAGEVFDLRAPADGAVVAMFYSIRCPGNPGGLTEAAALRESMTAGALTMVGVCVDPDATAEEVVEHARKHGLDVPIVHDPSGELARRFGVTVTPEAFVLVGQGKLVYRGGLPSHAALKLLRTALEAVVAGNEPPAARHEVTGCPVPEFPKDSREGPNYTEHVAPILRRSCQGCHRPGQSAPFSLLTYAQAAKRANDLADVAEGRLMPPWKPTSGIGPPLRHDRSLVPSEIETLRAWANAGAPRGAALEPDGPTFKEPDGGWSLGPPDLVLEMPEEFEVPASGNDVYRCFVLPTHLTEDRAVTAVEIRPGNPRVVHHTFNYIDIRGIGRRRDGEDPGPGYMCFSGFTGDSIFGAMGGWTPGNEPQRFNEGVGLNLPKGADVVMQVHYHPSGKPEKDRTRIGLYFASQPIRQSLQWVSACANPDEFVLSEGESEAHFRAVLTMPMDVELHAMTPHMHLLGRRFLAHYTLPNGRTAPLIEINDWDFNRQDTYYLREPLLLPAGTVVAIEGVFDNSEANPRNPSRPPREVRWGENATDDMLILFLALTDAHQDLTRPGARDTFMDDFFRKASAPTSVSR